MASFTWSVDPDIVCEVVYKCAGFWKVCPWPHQIAKIYDQLGTTQG